MKSYTLNEFLKDFPDEESCLNYIESKKKYVCVCGKKLYRTGRILTCSCGKQISLLKGTPAYRSSTPLIKWFLALYLFSVSKNGVSAKELQRYLGVTYKTAWRMGHAIRRIMKQGNGLLSGVVEVDETFFGGRKRKTVSPRRSIIMGMVERGGRVRAYKIPERETHILLNAIRRNVSKEAHIMSDEYSGYKKLPRMGYKRSGIKHGKRNYVRGNVYTNTIEGFWGQFKRSVSGTHHSVSHRYLQRYLDQFVWLRNHRSEPFRALLERL